MFVAVDAIVTQYLLTDALVLYSILWTLFNDIKLKLDQLFYVGLYIYFTSILFPNETQSSETAIDIFLMLFWYMYLFKQYFQTYGFKNTSQHV